MRCTIAHLTTKRVGVFLLLSLLVTMAIAVSGTLTATWDANTESDLAGYRVHYGPGSGNYTTVKDVGNQTVYVADNLPAGEEYYFAISAYDRFGNESELSTEVSAVVPDSSLQVDIEYVNGDVLLNWDSIFTADSYEIYRSSTAYEYSAALQNVSETTFTDPGVSPPINAGMYYKVVAFSNGQIVHEFDPVGVLKIEKKKGITLMSLPIVPEDRSLTSVIGSQLTGGTTVGASDQVIFFTDQGSERAWLVEGSGTQYDGKWMNEAGSAEFSQDIDPNISFVVRILADHTDTHITFCGTVPMETERTITLKPGENYVGSCFPVSVSLLDTELAQDAVVIGGGSSKDSDLLLSWNGATFDVAWLAQNTGTQYDGQWMEESGNAVSSIQFKPGKGYIINIKSKPTNNSWTYPNPGL